ncbi:hypothetical protein L226DRAFT_520589 [Lentinus tigrinus ALCF2SS1-7]|uniref:uncharacterized protein n=1 Tax=Lentinus tigrinus ALCF2SS1-7 TaxID=1328758 RepID=UPI0011662202|nr:hypothetical protein L226DRAFT_520589 [Lentinus tigrinus ALCF2SS1-7]
MYVTLPRCLNNVFLITFLPDTANAAASKTANPKKCKAQILPGTLHQVLPTPIDGVPIAPNAKKSKTALTADDLSDTNASARKRKHRDESDESDDEVDKLQDDTEGELDKDSSYRKRMQLDMAAPSHVCSKGVQCGFAVGSGPLLAEMIDEVKKGIEGIAQDSIDIAHNMFSIETEHQASMDTPKDSPYFPIWARLPVPVPAENPAREPRVPPGFALSAGYGSNHGYPRVHPHVVGMNRGILMICHTNFSDQN